MPRAKGICGFDMYLPKEQIEAMLQKCGLDFLDGVFVSCEYGVQKRSGKLFKLFLQQTALRPAEVLFVGDSPRADFAGQRWGYPLLFAAQPPRCHTPKPRRMRRWCRNCHPAKLLPESKSQCCAGGRAAWPLAVGFATWLHGQRAAYTGGKACIPGAGYVPGAPGVPAAVPRRRNLLPESIPPKPSARPAAMPNE